MAFKLVRPGSPALSCTHAFVETWSGGLLGQLEAYGHGGNIGSWSSLRMTSSLAPALEALKKKDPQKKRGRDDASLGGLAVCPAGCPVAVWCVSAYCWLSFVVDVFCMLGA